MWHAWEKGEKCTKFLWKSTKERDHSEDRGVDGIRMDLREFGLGEWWSGFSCIRIGNVVGCCERGDRPSGSGATVLVIGPSLKSILVLCLPFSVTVCQRLESFYHAHVHCSARHHAFRQGSAQREGNDHSAKIVTPCILQFFHSFSFFVRNV
jgi:hypothetical protein